MSAIKNQVVTPWDRLNSELARRRISWTALADALGLRKQAVDHWKNRGIPAKYLRRIADFLEKPMDWLELGVDSHHPTDDNVIEITAAVRMKKINSDELVIPQFETGGSMGDGLLLRDQPGVIRSWIVNSEWVQKNIKSHSLSSNLCIVTGFGDSMKGMFNSGDPLIVDLSINIVEYDAVYFFRVENEGFIKRLQRIPGEGLRVLSENRKYDSWTIKRGMDFEVFGRVVKAWQGEDF